ncbi:two-component system, OmpR family, sensor histidine kinase RstB [Aeromonas sp. RU39B]|uniref:two-component system sensor histidine kinase RstB n=1 Tax=Aeromonas sp. RU39B TaxID=1907416 RepID=UPI0009568E5A|nr:two-component system sensor histidine kinase RstB [Aeromonas sp. RU39B]SIR17654.1 two-component system, OmpR family, sensor histidine kinase RstB [Aeromonas sp. RU39B]
MRRLFIQFYLLLMACFMVAVLLVGMVYQNTAERAGNRYLEGLMQGSLDLLTTELARRPQAVWPHRLAEQSQQLNLPLRVDALSRQPLDQGDLAFLAHGDIVIVDDDDTFRQLIPGSDQVLIVGPVPYLSYLHEVRWIDVGLLLLLGLSLALPILLWLRPHWRGLLMLEQTARKLGAGDLTARSRLPAGSTLERTGRTLDQMADQLEALINGKKQLTDAIAHELRTPLVRLRYRLAMLEPAPEEQEMKALERDLGSLDRLIDEMLTYARLERPEMPLNPVDLELGAWVHLYLADWQTLAPEKTLQLEVRSDPIPWHGDERLLARAVENLVSNALRHANHQVTLTLERQHDVCLIRVQDDGPGIAPEHAARVFEPFVRLDESRDRRTGGTGLGLAIVRSIARHHGGDVVLLESESGAHFCIRLPAPQF